MKNAQHQGKRRKKLNNAGLSLVELIVAILILGIISAPLLQVFNTVIKANQVNKQRVAADAVAENIMEAIKYSGIKGISVEKYLWDHNTDANKTFFGISGITSVDFVDGNGVSFNGDGVSTQPLITKKSDAKDPWVFNKRAGNVYKYTLGGVSEGTDTFKVEVTLNATSSNNVKMDYDFAAFNDSSTRISLYVPGFYFDDQALAIFKQANRDYVDNQYLEAHQADPLQPANPPESAYKTESYLSGVIKRKLEILVKTNDLIDDSTEPYLVEATLHYYTDEEGIVSDKNPFSPPLCKIPIKELKDLFVFYVPYPYLSQARFDESVGAASYLYKNQSIETIDLSYNQNVVINNTVMENLKCFVAVQGKDCPGKDFLHKLSVTVEPTGKRTVLFSNTELNSTYPADFYKKRLINELSNRNTEGLIDVTIVVSKQNSDGTYEEMRTIRTTIEQTAE